MNLGVDITICMGLVLNVHDVPYFNPKLRNRIKTNSSLKIHTYKNYCMFETHSQKPVQNRQQWNTKQYKASKPEIHKVW